MDIFGNIFILLNQQISLKFDSTDFMPVPTDWSTSNDTSLVRENAVDGSIKIVTITNRGADLGTANQTYTGVPIRGDGTGAMYRYY